MTRGWRAGLLLLLAVAMAGCARLPRIDPSGERLFLFPNQQPSAVAGFNTPGGLLPPLGNVTAPAALGQTQPSGNFGLGVFGEGGILDRTLHGPTVVGPPVGVAQPGTTVVAPPVFPQATQPTGPLSSRLADCNCLSDRVSGDRVVITPQRVLAPVGTEVIVRSGVCGENGFLRVNREIEWLLAEQGVGEFVQVGEEGELDLGRLPWKIAKKRDNHYAVGYTSPYHTCLRRGNADPQDDIQVRKGDAWISVTSAREGASFVTAAAKSVENWDTRRASAIIYWVDAQWQFPASTTVQAGQPHTLTTLLTRQTDGTPLAGWIVRYEVQDPNAARLGYDAGESSEVVTDAQGRASIQMTPTDAAAGSTTVNMTVIRPAQTGTGASPRIDVGRGSTTINWVDGVGAPTPSVLPPINPPPLTPPAQPDFQPPTPRPVAPPQPVGRPQLEVRLNKLTPDPIKVGDTVQYEILVQNRGDGPARNVSIKDRFDRGLSHAGDDLNKQEIETNEMRDLGPGDSDRLPIEFKVLQAGRLSHEVTVAADNPAGGPRVEAFDRATFEAQPLAPLAPTLEVRFVDPKPVQASVGETASFFVVIENVGSTPATNVVARLRSNAQDLQITGYDSQPTNLGESFRDYNEGLTQVIEIKIPRLEAGTKTRPRQINAEAKRQNPRSCVTFEATADGGGNPIAEACVEVLPADPAAGGGLGPGGLGPGGLGPGAAQQANSPLAIEITETANPTAVGRTLQINMSVRNTGATTLRNVQIQTRIPPQQLLVQPTSVSPKSFTPFQDGTIVFDPISELRPNEQQNVLLTVQAVGQGVAVVSGSARSAEFPTGFTQTRNITVGARQ